MLALFCCAASLALFDARDAFDRSNALAVEVDFGVRRLIADERSALETYAYLTLTISFDAWLDSPELSTGEQREVEERGRRCSELSASSAEAISVVRARAVVERRRALLCMGGAP